MSSFLQKVFRRKAACQQPEESVLSNTRTASLSNSNSNSSSSSSSSNNSSMEEEKEQDQGSSGSKEQQQQQQQPAPPIITTGKRKHNDMQCDSIHSTSSSSSSSSGSYELGGARLRALLMMSKKKKHTPHSQQPLHQKRKKRDAPAAQAITTTTETKNQQKKEDCEKEEQPRWKKCRRKDPPLPPPPKQQPAEEVIDLVDDSSDNSNNNHDNNNDMMESLLLKRKLSTQTNAATETASLSQKMMKQTQQQQQQRDQQRKDDPLLLLQEKPKTTTITAPSSMNGDGNNDNDDTKMPATKSLATAASAILTNEASPLEHDELLLPPTCNELERLCWTCHVPLPPLCNSSNSSSSDVNNDNHNNNDDDDSQADDLPSKQMFMWYSKHSHALLKTPICSVCQDKVQGVMDDYAEDQALTEDVCAGCARRSYVGEDNNDDDDDDDAPLLLLCDNVEEKCNRAFCTNCVAQANGGGVEGWLITNREVNSTDEEHWKCPVCEPPKTLQSLQEATREPDEKKKRSEQDIVSDLANVERMKKECIRRLDAENEERDKVRDEYKANGLSGDELEQEVALEFKLWKKLQLAHLKRLDDSIVRLQDELDLSHNVTLAICYSKMLEAEEVYSTVGDNPDLIAAAEAENKKREEEQKQKPYKPLLPPSAYVNDNLYDSVDEIDDSSIQSEGDEEDESRLEAKREGWRNMNKPSEDQIQLALEAENRVIAEAEGRVSIRPVKEVEDVEGTLKEEVVAKLGGYKDAARIHEHGFRSFNHNHMPTIKENSRFCSTPRNKSVFSTNSQGKSVPSRFSSDTGGNSNVSTPAHSSQDTEYPSSSARKRARSEYHGTIFRGSRLVLCSSTQADGETHITPVRTVSVATKLSKKLKPHQADGVRFIWRNCFVDFEANQNGNPDDPAVGGCLLAHNMGLGKSLTTICTLHAVLMHPSMHGNLQTVLLVVPVNTIANWVNEFEEWTENLTPSIKVYNLSTFEKNSRRQVILKWKKHGGVLLLGDQTFLRLCKTKEKVDEKARDYLQSPDILVLDEAHTMVKSTGDTSKALAKVKTKRRILLTGTPFQNNLLEYYRMCEFIRPKVFGTNMTESKFEKEFVDLIMAGLASDSAIMAQDLSVMKSAELNSCLAPYMHRLSVAVLAKDLPPLSQAVLHVRPSRLQSNLYRRFSRLQKKDEELKNFFRAYTELRPITNHPYCLLVPSRTQQPKKAANPDNESPVTSLWWKKSLESAGVKPDSDDLAIESGYKVVLLLHILAYSELLGEKVLVFSQCLKTLDYVEQVLGLEDWKKHVPSLSYFSNLKLGGWKKAREYLRIDGDTKSTERGELVDTFNQDDVNEENARVFLISSLAGGIGINLTAASRVVMLDSHFNPTVNEQALFRAYRYGQERPVFCYRMLTEGSMENKIYSRSVNKQGLALRVIDKKSINRNFSAKEVEDLCSILNWVQCDRCQKWRVLLDETKEDVENIEWYCEMNSDAQHNSCDAPERNQFWYEMNCNARELVTVPKNHLKSNPEQEGNNDPILNHLLTVSETGKDTALISQHYFHDTLLKAGDVHDEVENARKRLADKTKPPSDECCIPPNAGEHNCGRPMASENNEKVPAPCIASSTKCSSANGNIPSSDASANHMKKGSKSPQVLSGRKDSSRESVAEKPPSDKRTASKSSFSSANREDTPSAKKRLSNSKKLGETLHVTSGQKGSSRKSVAAKGLLPGLSSKPKPPPKVPVTMQRQEKTPQSLPGHKRAAEKSSHVRNISRGCAHSPEEKAKKQLPIDAFATQTLAKKRSPPPSLSGLQPACKRTYSEKSSTGHCNVWKAQKPSRDQPSPEVKAANARTGAIASDDAFDSSDDEAATQRQEPSNPPREIKNAPANRKLKFDKCLGDKNGCKQPKIDVDLSNDNDELEVIDLCNSDED